MFKPRSTHFRSGLSAWIVLVMLAMVVLPASITLQTSVAGHTSNYEFRSHAVRLHMEPAAFPHSYRGDRPRFPAARRYKNST